MSPDGPGASWRTAATEDATSVPTGLCEKTGMNLKSRIHFQTPPHHLSPYGVFRPFQKDPCPSLSFHYLASQIYLSRGVSSSFSSSAFSSSFSRPLTAFSHPCPSCLLSCRHQNCVISFLDLSSSFSFSSCRLFHEMTHHPNPPNRHWVWVPKSCLPSHPHFHHYCQKVLHHLHHLWPFSLVKDLLQTISSFSGFLTRAPARGFDLFSLVFPFHPQLESRLSSISPAPSQGPLAFSSLPFLSESRAHPAWSLEVQSAFEGWIARGRPPIHLLGSTPPS